MRAAGKEQEIVAGDSRLLENFDKASMKPSFAFIEFPHHAAYWNLEVIKDKSEARSIYEGTPLAIKETDQLHPTILENRKNQSDAQERKDAVGNRLQNLAEVNAEGSLVISMERTTGNVTGKQRESAEVDRWMLNVQKVGENKIIIPDPKLPFAAKIEFEARRTEADELLPGEEPYMYLSFIRTHDAYRERKGVGTAIMKYWIEKTLTKSGLKVAKLMVDGGRSNYAYKLYLKCGFTWDDADDDSNYDMTLRLENYDRERCR
ncbi:hypothetical protein DdX_21843 [Ditylenchus destructor]|uniref:N-acetyltransferase domain-containing protein n=1 Tax=Ditylenchus destructor TaxID=166010 RepID=A0AAD4MEX2_9BILA|nr:hypothetical protein DdX_21843 [Ditylenchus destructor]